MKLEPAPRNKTHQFANQRFKTLLWLLFIIPIGFYSKFYRGPAAEWVNDSLGGVFYEWFWCLLLLLIWPFMRPALIASIVLIGTCALEFLQLWHPPLLQVLRSTFIGRTLLGTTFFWSDIPYYFIGCGTAWIWMKRIKVRSISDKIGG